MSEPHDVNELIEFSSFGIRLAVADSDGHLSHYDNWEIETFGGIVPGIGDHFTLLWDDHFPDEVEHYRVLERHYVSELEGDTCWWLLST